ncbi:hypothetical protein [Kosakonia calanthes]|uniref:hypothetical protein n=1 Tax=Kosakonia calanthes TaxID=3139408 RepID=UPI003CC7F95C
MSIRTINSPFDRVTSGDQLPDAPAPTFGFEEMLTELEVIVAEAVIRLAEEEATA